MSYLYETILGLKSLAKKIQADQPIKLHDALDRAALMGGFQNFAHAKRVLPADRLKLYNVTISQRWWGYESRQGGDCKISISLRTPLNELVRPHNLVAGLKICRIRDDLTVELDTHVRDAEDARKCVAETARLLQFMDATGFRLSDSNKCYPKGQWHNRPPVADHDQCWYDPTMKFHILSTNPYPGRLDFHGRSQESWNKFHDWKEVKVGWGSLYSDRTELYVVFPSKFGELISQKVARLEKYTPRVCDRDPAIVILRS